MGGEGEKVPDPSEGLAYLCAIRLWGKCQLDMGVENGHLPGGWWLRDVRVNQGKGAGMTDEWLFIDTNPPTPLPLFKGS